MADHHAVGVRAAEKVVGELKVLVNFGDGRALLRRLGKLRRQAVGLRVFFQIVAGGDDDLFHDGGDDDHPGGDLERPGKPLEEIEDEFIWAVEHENAGREDAAGNALWNAGGDGLVLELLGEGADSLGRSLFGGPAFCPGSFFPSSMGAEGNATRGIMPLLLEDDINRSIAAERQGNKFYRLHRSCRPTFVYSNRRRRWRCDHTWPARQSLLMLSASGEKIGLPPSASNLKIRSV